MSTSRSFSIRTLRSSELAFAQSCTHSEEWQTETYQELESIYEHDRQGFFIALAADEPIGICAATGYGSFGFVGELIVVKESREQGVGTALLRHAVLYLQGKGTESILLDGVLQAVPLYEREGFVRICRSWRLSGSVAPRAHASIYPMVQTDLEAVCRLDRAVFQANRQHFLRRRFQNYPALCKVMRQHGELVGFIMGRPSDAGLSIGPWIVRPDCEDPCALLEAMAHDAPECELKLGVLDHAPQIQAELSRYNLQVSPFSPWRMCLGPVPRISPQQYAIGSPAKG